MNSRGKKSAVYGQLVDHRGNGSPVEVIAPEVIGPVDRVGYTPDRLDAVIGSFVQNAEASSNLLLQYGPLLGQLLNKANTELMGALQALSPPVQPKEGETPKDFPVLRFSQIVELTDSIARILERLAKITKSSTEALDDSTRLRAFVVGIEDTDDGGLAGKGETELRRMVMDAASGWQKPTDET